jgi:hypothetical protein
VKEFRSNLSKMREITPATTGAAKDVPEDERPQMFDFGSILVVHMVDPGAYKSTQYPWLLNQESTSLKYGPGSTVMAVAPTEIVLSMPIGWKRHESFSVFPAEDTRTTPLAAMNSRAK